LAAGALLGVKPSPANFASSRSIPSIEQNCLSKKNATLECIRYQKKIVTKLDNLGKKRRRWFGFCEFANPHRTSKKADLSSQPTQDVIESVSALARRHSALVSEGDAQRELGNSVDKSGGALV